ncbi:MAG: hypothetical protein SAK29_22960 [Scytonema sp. PMC 1069.18]|nr:hypothetical protein [Scytonema sp. PMC 1069.18]MEC4887886.1 hypothetical protein [Scytonema sp. PMC 1070.18]
MKNNIFLTLNTLQNGSSHLDKVVEVELVQARPDVTPPYSKRVVENSNTLNAIMFLLPFSLITFWLLIAFKLLNTLNSANNKIATFNILTKVPCRNCQYFANNPFLKCAVRPDTALTEEAMNCPDYCPKKGQR